MENFLNKFLIMSGFLSVNTRCMQVGHKYHPKEEPRGKVGPILVAKWLEKAKINIIKGTSKEKHDHGRKGEKEV